MQKLEAARKAPGRKGPSLFFMKKSGESMLLILINRLALIVLYDGVLIFRDRALLLGARPTGACTGTTS